MPDSKKMVDPFSETIVKIKEALEAGLSSVNRGNMSTYEEGILNEIAAVVTNKANMPVDKGVGV